MSFSSKIKLLSSSRKDLKVEILMHVITVEEKAGFYIPKTQDPGHSNIKASTVLCCAWSLSCVQCFVTPWTVAHQAPLFMEISPGKNIGVGCHALLQGMFPTQGSNPGLSHCSWLFYQLSHEGSPHLGIRNDYFSL